MAFPTTLASPMQSYPQHAAGACWPQVSGLSVGLCTHFSADAPHPVPAQNKPSPPLFESFFYSSSLVRVFYFSPSPPIFLVKHRALLNKHLMGTLDPWPGFCFFVLLVLMRFGFGLCYNIMTFLGSCVKVCYKLC